MAPSFHTADRQTYRRIVVLGVLFCAVFLTISLSLRPQHEGAHVVVKADRPIRTASDQLPAN